MAKLFNRAKMTTTTTGSGTITLGSASNGFQSFADAGVADGDVVQYVIEEGANFEIGTGTYSATGTSLTRSPSESSNSDAAIALAGQATVSITAVADDLNRLQHNGSDKVTVSSTGASVTGNLAVSGTVDGVDVSAFKSAYDSHNHDGRYYTESEINTRMTYTLYSPQTLTSSDNLNSVSHRGWYGWGSSDPTNAPYDYGMLIDGKDGSQPQQLVQTYGGASNKVSLYGRRRTSGTWDTAWTQYFSDHYHPNADKWTTARTLSLTGGVTGSVSWDGSANASLTSTVALATASAVGGIKIGYAENGKNYPVELDGNGKAYVNVPWTDTNTNQLTTFVVQDGDSTNVTMGQGKYLKFAEGGAIDVNFTDTSTGSSGDPYDLTISHADTSSQGSVNNSNGTVIQDVTLDGYGHVTALGSVDLDGRYVNVTGDTVTGTLEHSYSSVVWQHGEGYWRPVSRKLYSEAGNIGTTGSNFTDVYGEADLSAIDNGETFTYAAAWEAVESHGGRLPTLAEIMDGVGAGSGQGYDSYFLWTCTPAGPHHVWVAYGAYSGTTERKIVDITDTTEVYRTRAFFDVSRDNRVSTYSSDGHLRDGNDRVFHDSYHPNADKWTTARTLSLSGDASGSVSWDGSANATLSVAVNNDSHTHAFNNLTGKVSGTGEYSTDSNLVSGRGSGGVALTINDGYGNANVTWNHKNGVPEQNGQSARIEVNTDSTTGEGNMHFEVSSAAVTGGTAINIPVGMTLAHDYLEIPNQIRHAGDTDTYMQFHAADQWRVVTGGSERLEVNNDYTKVQNSVAILNGGTIATETTTALHVTKGAAGEKGVKITNQDGDAHTWFAYTNGSNYITSDADNTDGSTYIRKESGGTYTDIAKFDSSLNTTLYGDLTIPSRIYHQGDTDTYLQFHGNDLFRVVVAGAEVQEWGNNYTLLSDNDTLRLGSGSDFRMWFNGTDTYFRNYAHSGGDVIFQGEDSSGNNETAMRLDFSGASSFVQLYQASGERLRTLSGGVGVTGLCVGDVDANPHNSNGVQVKSSNNEKIVLSGSTNPYIRWQENTTDKAYIQWNSAGYLDFRNQENGQFKFQSTVDGQAATIYLVRNDK